MITQEARNRKASCGCICHDLSGGPIHPGQRCRCNGGEGYDAFERVCSECGATGHLDQLEDEVHCPCEGNGPCACPCHERES